MVFILFSHVGLSLLSGLLSSDLPLYKFCAFIFLLVYHILRLKLLDLIMRIVISVG
jgi:hypothetical protein